MNQLPQMAFSHIGLYVTDMASMVSFYTGVLGFSVTDRARIRGNDVVFLSRSPDEHHQIVLVPGRAPQSPSTVNQISFRVIALAELRRLHAQLVGLGVSGINPTNHGGSWSVYFSDPEGNRIEFLAQTPWYVPPISVSLTSPCPTPRFTVSLRLWSKRHLAICCEPAGASSWSGSSTKKERSSGGLRHLPRQPLGAARRREV